MKKKEKTNSNILINLGNLVEKTTKQTMCKGTTSPRKKKKKKEERDRNAISVLRNPESTHKGVN